MPEASFLVWTWGQVLLLSLESDFGPLRFLEQFSQGCPCPFFLYLPLLPCRFDLLNTFSVVGLPLPLLPPPDGSDFQESARPPQPQCNSFLSSPVWPGLLSSQTASPALLWISLKPSCRQNPARYLLWFLQNKVEMPLPWPQPAFPNKSAMGQLHVACCSRTESSLFPSALGLLAPLSTWDATSHLQMPKPYHT